MLFIAVTCSLTQFAFLFFFNMKGYFLKISKVNDNRVIEVICGSSYELLYLTSWRARMIIASLTGRMGRAICLLENVLFSGGSVQMSSQSSMGMSDVCKYLDTSSILSTFENG